MIEAFEIGVSLALQDGVSDAIGKARRDVAALEHAVRDSGVSVQSLRDAGDRVSSVSFGDWRRPMAEEPVARVVPDTAPPVEREVETASFVPLLGAIQTEQPGGGAHDALAPRADAPARETDIAAPQLPVAAPVAPLPPAAGGAESAQEGYGQASAPLAVLGLADGPGGAPKVGGDGVAPVVVPAQDKEVDQRRLLGSMALPGQFAAALLGQDNEVQAFPQIPQPVASPERRSQRAGGDVSLLNALRLSGGSVAIPQDEDQNAAVAAATPVAGDDGHNEHPQRAPVVTARAYGVAAPDGAAASGARAESGPQQAEAGAAGPREGDVFLDGMLVGRWMSKFLNREAARASAGPTGFDARRGRLLPGVTVGG